MTPEMIEKARKNAEEAGAKNVELRLGEIESMPVEDESVDWVISNCVINLAPGQRSGFSGSTSRPQAGWEVIGVGHCCEPFA